MSIDLTSTEEYSKLYQLKCELSEEYLGIPMEGGKIRRRVHKPYLHSNLIGIGISEKRIGGLLQKVPAVTFFVKRKIHNDDLPEKSKLPTERGDLQCDVVSCRYVRPANQNYSPSIPQDPVLPGAQISTVQGHFGTLGGFMKNAGGERFLVSNCHVLSPSNLRSIGLEVFQPAQGTHGWRRIGIVTYVVRLKMLELNYVDLALARIDDNIHVDPTTMFGKITGTSTLSEGTPVRKMGAGSNQKQGTSVAVEVDNVIPINGNNYRFRDLQGFRPGPFAVGGDSGSAVISLAGNSLVSMIMGETDSVNLGCSVAAIKTALKKDLPDYDWWF